MTYFSEIKKEMGNGTIRHLTISFDKKGVYAEVFDDGTDCFGYPIRTFYQRDFKVCAKFPSIESNIIRAKKYYEMY